MVGFVIGYFVAVILDFSEYYFQMKKVKYCKHLEWKFDDNYTYRVYDSNKENPKTCERFTCYHCGKVEYKEWRINNGN
jgi:hypothetical protein